MKSMKCAPVLLILANCALVLGFYAPSSLRDGADSAPVTDKNPPSVCRRPSSAKNVKDAADANNRPNDVASASKSAGQEESCVGELKAAVFGFYRDGNGSTALTREARRFDQQTKGKIAQFLNTRIGEAVTEGKSRILWDLAPEYEAVAIVCIGDHGRGVNEVEQIHEQREAVRKAVAAGVKGVWDVSNNDLTNIEIDVMDDPEAAAESAYLVLWKSDSLKADKKLLPTFTPLTGGSQEEEDAWRRGKLAADAQNFARYLAEMPANLMTPTIFAEEARKALEPLGATVNIYDKSWIESENMGSFLSVSAGSVQPPVFLEILYNGSESSSSSSAPIVLVGKGITFDSGGVSLKTPSSSMMWMRTDMAGGAVVVATILALAKLKEKQNVVGLVSLTENMMGGSATKVMDVVTAKNGKTIEVANTDAEGRLVLADALVYAEKFNAKAIIDIATLTGAAVTAVGRSASAVFTRHPTEWDKMLKASYMTGDRVWRMPLWSYHTAAITDGHLADLSNTNAGTYEKLAPASTGAAFLKEFVPKDVPWIHMDIAGSSRASTPSDSPYYTPGVTGRPVRTLLKYIVGHDDD